MNKLMQNIILFSALLSLRAMADVSVNCATIVDNVERLACYDKQAADAIVSDTKTQAMTTAIERASDSSTSLPSDEKSNAVDRFGLRNKVDVIDEVRSRLLGPFKGWSAKTEFVLENGQVWYVVDGSSASFIADAPEVVIKEGTFGAYFLRIEGLNKSPRVKRKK